MKPANVPIGTPFGARGHRWSGGLHRGVDLLTPSGTEVVAPWSGVVVEAGSTSWGPSFGTAVVIAFDPLPDGQPGLWGILAHLSAVTVRPGARVAAGGRVGRSGATGNVSGPHLHFEVQRDRRWRSDRYVNPKPWLEATKYGGAMSVDYWYSGKPAGTLRVKQAYVTLDIDEWDPPRTGLELIETYLNCSGFVFEGNMPGRIRVCLERDPKNSNRTGYHDYTVVPGQTELLITALHFEQGDGTRTWHLVKCMDGLLSMEIGTRYAKRAVIR